MTATSSLLRCVGLCSICVRGVCCSVTVEEEEEKQEQDGWKGMGPQWNGCKAHSKRNGEKERLGHGAKRLMKAQEKNNNNNTQCP